ncbi:LLM class F420-dependent oxidoreductase [Streptomyces leeuwenhoekii]|uniref:5,10-methylene tetrahydromethanopterin reductase n=1 Tax=Streptomyces leeuwenhoekii TaxID=1437453 RepID=A0A0F7VLL5_STRLW|nr:LLM class F420-dependent oxidoreductase [Streptomyces leeuwenhoekii]KMS71983.1 5,10-methylene tetrahydromethanopterin reductase [Streptomyces leeuwenhoekii]CQR60484.1 Rif-orf11 homologue, Flavin-dependent oxidoreductase [Streptomyces leeuwenhoekii]
MTAETKPFRFCVDMVAPTSRSEWIEKCRKAEDLGYDVLGVADHLGMPAPFPSLVLAAEHTERIRLTTFVLNAGFYNPALLAREVTGTDQLTDGRLEFGIGAGYVEAEFDAAGIPFPSPRERLDHLERTVKELKRLYGDPEHKPQPVQKPGPPLLMGGRGDRLLRLAAEHADSIGFIGTSANTERMSLASRAELAERIDFTKAALGARAPQVELNVLAHFVRITDDRRAALEELHQLMPDLTVEQLGELPTVLVGTATEVAEQILAHRESLGISYYTVIEHNLEALAPVIELLHGK